jgi:inner membrane protein
MEPLTHNLTALMLARASLNRWCPRATAVALAAANAPDVDFVGALGGDLGILEWHRGLTHSLIVAPVMALLPLAVLWPWLRRLGRRRRLYLVSLAGVLSHILLDWTNIYGVRLLAPFDPRWRRLDLASVVDFWVLAVLIGAAGWMALARLVSSEIGSRPPAGRGAAIFALAAMLGLFSMRCFLHERAVAVLEARLYDGEEPVRAAAFPTVFNPFRWRGLVETETAWRVFEVDLAGGQFDPAGGRTYYKPELPPAAEAARATYPFRVFLDFAQFALWRVIPAEEPEGALRIEALELRFAAPGEEAFLAAAIVKPEGEVLRAWFQYHRPGTAPRFR